MKLAGKNGQSELARLAELLKDIKRPPVHLWNPDYCGDIDMRIARDGSWHYMGSPIARIAMVKLFASVLRRDGEDYFLVTPGEKIGITVDDAPFTAVELEAEGAGAARLLRFRTNVEEIVEAGPGHPIRVETDALTGEPAPYILVRDRLEALISRSVFYDLVAMGEQRRVDGREVLGVFGGGEFFVLGAVDEDDHAKAD